MQGLRLFVGIMLAVVLFCPLTFAQGNHVVHVGVTVMQDSAVGLSSTAARDKLIKVISHQKDSKAGLTLDGVAISASSGVDMMTEAKQKNCEFVVETKLIESHEEGGLSQKQTVYAGSSTNVPEYSATIEYKVSRVSDGATIASGAGKATDIGSQAEVVSQAIDHVAGKVLADIKKAAAPAK